MPLSQQAKDIISELPLDDTLDSSQRKLGKNLDNPRREDIASLLGALVISPTAFKLSSPDGSGNVAAKLFSIQQHVRGGLMKLDHFYSLFHHVVSNSSDIDIWEAVFDIIDNLGVLTPPPSSIAPTFQGTPVRSSSSRLSDREPRNIVERELFFEIRDCTFRDVGGFCDKFFNTKSWDERQKEMLESVMAEHDGNRWKTFPTVPAERLVWDWLRSLEDGALSGAPHKLYTTKTAHEFKEPKGQIDLFFQLPAPEPSGKLEYKHVLVVGEQKSSYDTGRFKADFLQLTRLVRGVFTDQPTRRFVHAFTLIASMMELWVFDRSGAYSSGAFDIHNEPGRFARALISYATMDDNAMGLDTFIEREGKHHYVTVDDVDSNKARIRLLRPIVRQSAIVCRGTTCYETQDGHVAKFSWASDKRKLEVKQLRLAETKGVRGVARVVAHSQITTIDELRQGLEFEKRHKFRNDDVHFEDIPSVGTIDISSQKRKSASDHWSDASESKKPRSNSQQSTLVVRKQNSKQRISTGKPSLYNSDGDMWENRIYSCLVISPAGRVISDFRTIKELLGAVRDAIRGHQSLYETGNILHRDISSNNIIITKPEMAGGFNGMLIDLDLAKVRDSGPSGARHQTGTMQFMAVQVLRKTDHTYRHDLESFFYVLLWMCARQSWRNGFASSGEKPPKESVLRGWEIGSFKDIARTKAGDMTVDGLEGIMTEFPGMFNHVQPLCLRIRKILFPLDKDERMSFGTPAGDPNQLYSPIIAAFDDAVNNM
ncbi:serine/threonine-protein kinase Sgk2 [Xylaria bambusicola]|uniref:serine/threonine-protein kinase Sgk2 n=1 Tax=Xylaria bambusicola TaxID=326684 RepID=UPI002007D84F|nr:serine/threonine-protein kinase Sgk2 [Xylaria bambusicola]KAI0525828.1 serine/threonine-protein kinase Sgk2 [Xylaria bambusicola]